MSSQGTLSGRRGRVMVGSATLARCTQWTLTKTKAGGTEWGDSDSQGFTNRGGGRRDATGTVEFKLETSVPQYNVVEEGDHVQLALWLDGAEAGSYFVFPRVQVSDVNLTVDMDSQEVIGGSFSWGADGVFYAPGESGAPSIAPPIV